MFMTGFLEFSDMLTAEALSTGYITADCLAHKHNFAMRSKFCNPYSIWHFNCLLGPHFASTVISNSSEVLFLSYYNLTI